MKTKTKPKLKKCKHDKCERQGMKSENGYCNQCIQLPSKACNYCRTKTLEHPIPLSGPTPNTQTPPSEEQRLQAVIDDIMIDNRLQWIAIVGVVIVLIAVTLVITIGG